MTPGFTLLLIAIVLLTVTLLPHWRNTHWLVRCWEFPRYQLGVIAAALMITVALAGLLGRIEDHTSLYLSLICLGLTCAMQWRWILPYTPIFPSQVRQTDDSPNDSCISILTANVLMHNRNAKFLISLINRYQPDIIVTLESDSWWHNQLMQVGNKYPHRMTCPQNNLYGMHVFSKRPLLNRSIQYRVEPGVPSMRAEVMVNQQPITLYFVHPAPPSPTENSYSLERDIELLMVAKEAKNDAKPIIVAGDLNDVAWSKTTRDFLKISGLRDPRVGRGMFNTYNAKVPLARWPLDHIFHSHHFRLCNIQRLPAIGSDHFPIYIKLCLEHNIA